MSSHEISEVFPAGESPALKLSNISGEVVIVGAPISELRIEAHKRDNGDARNTLIHIQQHDDGCVEIKVEHEKGPLGWLSSPKLCSVDFDIQVPHSCKVEVSLVSANLEARHLQGPILFTTVSGEMDLDDLQGELSISTVSGGIEASNLAGALHLHTVSGDVSMESSKLDNLRLSTVSADIELESAIQAEGTYHLSTVSGSIDWNVPESTACRFHSSAISGGIYVNEARAARRQHGGKHHTLALGEGGPDIHLSSVSGDLRIHTPVVPEITH